MKSTRRKKCKIHKKIVFTLSLALNCQCAILVDHDGLHGRRVLRGEVVRVVVVADILAAVEEFVVVVGEFVAEI